MAARETKPNGKSQLIRDLKNGEFATLYIISGEESYMKEYYLRQLRQKVVDETFADFNLIEFEGKGLTPEMLTEAIDSYPAMADKKLIIVKDFDLFKPPAGFADVLPSVLGDLPEYVCLVFYYDVLDGKPDKRTKLYKTLEKHACFAEFAHAEEQELVAWLERRAKALGCMIEPGDASYMIFLCGNSMTNLAGEMEKAAAHTTTGVIKRYNIDAVCSPVLDAVVFDLTDAVTAGRFDRAVALVGELLAQKNNEVMIFTAITRHIQRDRLEIAVLRKADSECSTACAAQLAAKGGVAVRGDRCRTQGRRSRPAEADRADAAHHGGRAEGGKEMTRIREAILVEGRYDVNTVRQVVDTVVLESGGFRIFNNKDQLKLLRRIAETRGLIVLTDSDGAGFVIRNYLKGALPKGCVKQAYVPDIAGKERRKRHGSKEGKLGVEGMRPQVILDALRRAGATFAQQDESEAPVHPVITKADFYEWGLSGRPDSTARRAAVLHALDLPEHMTANALLEFINAVGTHEQVAEIIQQYVEKIEE